MNVFLSDLLPSSVVKFFVLEIEPSVRVGDGADHPAGISCRQAPRGDVLRHHTARTDDTAVPDMDTGGDDDAAANPDVIADGHIRTILIAAVPAGRVQGMSGGVDGYVGRQHTVVTKGDLPNIQQGAVVIKKYIFAHADMVPIVAVEGGTM